MSRSVEALRKAGFRVVVDETCDLPGGLAALPPEQLAATFHRLVADPEVDAILGAVGGWTINSVLSHLDYTHIAASRKVIVGYSDLAALLWAILARAGLVTFHGPTVLPEWGEAGGVAPYTRDNFLRVVSGFDRPVEFRPPERYTDEFLAWDQDDSRPRALRPASSWVSFRHGTAEGPLIGGCMSTFALQLGTEFMPPLDGAILFLEEEDKAPDRYLAYLESFRQQGVFDAVAGLIVGRFSRPRAMLNGFADMLEPLEIALRGVEIPIALDVDLGHTEPMLTLPMGARATLDCRQPTPSIYLVESAVADP